MRQLRDAWVASLGTRRALGVQQLPQPDRLSQPRDGGRRRRPERRRRRTPAVTSAVTSAAASEPRRACAAPVSLLLPDWVFENFLFRPWPGRGFAGDHWHGLVTGLSIAVSLGSSALWMLEQRLRRLGRPISPRTIRAVCIAVTSLAFLGYFDFFNPNTRYEPYYPRHDFYHYYLAPNYFGEIGYGRLYPCTAVAEVELGRGAEIRRKSLTDLDGSNRIIPITESY